MVGRPNTLSIDAPTFTLGLGQALTISSAVALEKQFAEIAESQPELLARHYTEAGLIEKARQMCLCADVVTPT
jgi:hypothetical protein